MTLSSIDLMLHRKGTRSFIDSDPSEIVLFPQGEQIVNGTKTFVAELARNPQRFKVIWAGDNGIVREPDSAGGVRRFDFILVGEYDAEVAIGDFWKVGTQVNQVEYVFPANGYEVKAGGVSHGAEPSGE